MFLCHFIPFLQTLNRIFRSSHYLSVVCVIKTDHSEQEIYELNTEQDTRGNDNKGFTQNEGYEVVGVIKEGENIKIEIKENKSSQGKTYMVYL